jgi:ribonuclease-3
MKEGLLRKRIRNWLIGLGIDALDLKIYIESLTHRSFAREINVEYRGNEQLEFLGDSVLSFIITGYLYENYNYYSEGNLSKIRSNIISRRSLADIAKIIEIDRQILLSENEEFSNGRSKESIIADAFEAFIGALYTDKGIDFTCQWFLDRFESFIEGKIKSHRITDFKSFLQEAIQADYSRLVKYAVKESEGPAHNKVFFSVAKLSNQIIGHGKGKSKKESEQEAAKDALKSLYNMKI